MKTVAYKDEVTGGLWKTPLINARTDQPFERQSPLVLRSDAEESMANLKAHYDKFVRDFAEMRARAERLEELLMGAFKQRDQALGICDNYAALLTQVAETIGEEAFAVNMDGIIVGPDFYSLPDLVKQLTKRRGFWATLKHYLVG